MTPEETQQLFARLNGTGLDKWLSAEWERCAALIAEHTDVIAIHRAQGRMRLLSDLLKQLDAARSSH